MRNCFGEPLNFDEVYSRGPLVLKFFAGLWSSTCVADLEVLQENFETLSELGATVVAVSTQNNDKLLRHANEHDLSFHLVSDRREEITSLFGLVVKISDELSHVFKEVQGIKLAKHHGKSAPEIALPATFVIDRTGTIVYAHFSEDMHGRPEMNEVIQAIKRVNIDQQ